MKEYKIRVNNFKKMEDPNEISNKKKYVCYVKVGDVPDNFPMATNPREQNLKTSVAKEIKESLLSNDGDFHLKNRGIVISASKVHYDNKLGIMTLIFEDDYTHGNVDGGHTYKIILEHKDKELNQYVQFEILEGVEEIIEGLASARNTSTQVDTKSLAELEQKFDIIKDAIGGMPFFGRVAFKQFQYSDIRGHKPIDAREIIAILTMFNIDDYSSFKHPISAYNSKQKVLDDYLANSGPYEKMINIAPDIFDLYDQIELDFPIAYNNSGGRYGSRKYSGYKSEGAIIGNSKFRGEDIQYKVPDGIMYPVIGAFRALIEENKETGCYEWIKDPFDVYQSVREQISNKIMRLIDSIGNNPNAAGKDSTAWDVCYMTVEREIR